MSFTIRTRGAHSQLMLQDFLCPECGFISALAPRDCDGIQCPDGCGNVAGWVISAPFGWVNGVSVVRGGVAKADSPMYLDTRPLGEGMPMAEWKANRAKLQLERRHKERKKLYG